MTITGPILCPPTSQPCHSWASSLQPPGPGWPCCSEEQDSHMPLLHIWTGCTLTATTGHCGTQLLSLLSSHFPLPFSVCWAHPCLSPQGLLSHVIPALQWLASSQRLDFCPSLHGPVLTGLGGHGGFPLSCLFSSHVLPLLTGMPVYSPHAHTNATVSGKCFLIPKEGHPVPTSCLSFTVLLPLYVPLQAWPNQGQWKLDPTSTHASSYSLGIF